MSFPTLHNDELLRRILGSVRKFADHKGSKFEQHKSTGLNNDLCPEYFLPRMHVGFFLQIRSIGPAYESYLVM